MTTDVYLVVGDEYSSFARAPSVITQAQLRSMVKNGPDLTGVRFVLGQGLDADLQAVLKEGLESLGALDIEQPGPMAPLDLTHKRHPRHVLISAPQPAGPAWYRFDLVVDNAKDRLSDHVTGQHIGAMLLIEAARQAVIAAIECHCARSDGVSWGLVLQSLNCHFDNYVFPLPTQLMVRISPDAAPQSQQEVVLIIDFLQVGKLVCKLEFRVGLYRPDILARLEGRRAVQAVTDEVRQRARSASGIEADLVP